MHEVYSVSSRGESTTTYLRWLKDEPFKELGMAGCLADLENDRKALARVRAKRQG